MSRRTQLTESAGAQSTPTYVQGRQLEMSLASNAEPISSTPGPAVSFFPPPPPPPLPSFVQGNSRDGESASGADAVSGGSTTDTTQTRSRTLPTATGASTTLIPGQPNIGMRVRALHKFEPTAEEDLGFEKGDIITIVGREVGSDWWDGHLNGRTGIVPSNFVEPIPEPSANQSLATQQPISHGYGSPRPPISSYSYTPYTPGLSFSPSPGTISQQAPISSPYAISPYSGSTTQSAPAQMWRPTQTPGQSASIYNSGTQSYSQSPNPRPMSYASSPQAYPGLQYQTPASAQSYSAPGAPATPYSTNLLKPTSTSAAASGRNPTRKKTDAFVANDPFRPRPQSQAHKTDKPTSDNLTFDDIPVAGTPAASNPAWTSSTPHYGSGSQSQNAPKPSQSTTHSWYNATPSGDQGSQSQTPMKPPQSTTPSWYNAGPSGDQGSQSYPTAPPTSTQSPAPYNPGSSSYPSYGDQPSAPQSQGPSRYSQSQPVDSQTPYPISSPYPVYEAPPQHTSTGSPRPPTQLPYGSRPPSPDWPGKVPTARPSTPVPPRSDTPYDPYQPHYSPPIEPYRPLDPMYPPFPNPLNNYPDDIPPFENRRSTWARVKRFFRHPFSSSRRYEDIFGPESAQITSEGGYSKAAVKFILGTLPSQIYLHILLRMPSLYFSRVARIFEEADLTLPEIKKMALETASEGKNHELDFHNLEATNVPPQYEKLKLTWENFIDSVMREWKTFNIISVLLLSAILTILQIDAAAADPVSRYAALFSLICALMSLLFGCMYIIRFGSMRKTYKAAEWALEAKRTKTVIWWNVWVLLAMPVIWLTWSIILYIVCIMSFIWRTGSPDAPPPAPLSHQGLLAIRVIITIVLGIGFIYGALIISTFQRYGEAMDKAWKQRIESWLEEKAAANPLPPTMYNPRSYNDYLSQQPLFDPSFDPQYSQPVPPFSVENRAPSYKSPSYTDLGYSGYSSDVKGKNSSTSNSTVPPYTTVYSGYSSDVKGKSSSSGSSTVPPYTPYAPYYQNLAEPQTQTRSNTPDSAESTVELTRANTLQNKTAHLDRTPSTSSGHSAIYNGPGHPTSHPLPTPPNVTVTSNDLPPPPRLVTKLAQPPPPSLPPIPGTPMTASRFSGSLSSHSLKSAGSGIEPASAHGDEDADLQSAHVHFRSPLASAQGSNSPWGGSFSGASLRSERTDPARPVDSPQAGPSRRPDNTSYESVDLKKDDSRPPSS